MTPKYAKQDYACMACVIISSEHLGRLTLQCITPQHQNKPGKTTTRVCI